MASTSTPATEVATVSRELAAKYSKRIEEFVDREDITHIEVASFNESSKDYLEEVGKLPFASKDWLDPNSDLPCLRTYEVQRPQRLLRLLILPFNHSVAPSQPFPPDSFREVEDLHGLEENYLSHERLQSTSISFRVPLENGCEGFVIKVGKWDDDATDYSLSVMFDPKTARSCCVLRILIKKDLHALKKRLRELHHQAWYPLVLATILVELRTNDLPETIGRIRSAVYRIEKTTGTHKNYLRKLGLTRAKGRLIEEVWDDPEFSSAPGELTSIASDCAYYESSCLMRQELLDWIGKMNKSFSARMSIGQPADLPQACRMLSDKLEFLSASLTYIRIRSSYMAKRAEVQVQTCHSLMAQRDNALNKRTTDASLELTRFSRMDSTDMRTIASVTLAFLPATFVATLFSTSFFGFGSEREVVSPWIWLYCLITVILTMAVYVGWYLYSKRQRAPFEKELQPENGND